MPSPTKKQRAAVCRIVDKWKPRLLLDGWAVILVFAEEQGDSSDIKTDTLATMVTNSRYTEGRLTIYPAFFRESSEAQQACIIHELIHIRTEPLRLVLEQAANKRLISKKRAIDISEDNTEYITKLQWKSYFRNKKKVKDWVL